MREQIILSPSREILIKRRIHLFHIAGNSIFYIIFLSVTVRILIDPVLLMKETISRLYTTLIEGTATYLSKTLYHILLRNKPIINDNDTKLHKKAEKIK